MSVDAGLFLTLSCARGSDAIVDALLKSEWSPHSDGWCCVPMNEDCSEWRLTGGDAGDVKALFKAKMKAEETFGVQLWWQGEEVGGEFLVFPDCTLIFSPSINRMKLDERITDVSWYVKRLLPIFRCGKGVDLDNWSWRETA